MNRCVQKDGQLNKELDPTEDVPYLLATYTLALEKLILIPSGKRRTQRRIVGRQVK